MLPPPRAIVCRRHQPGAGEQVSAEPTQHRVPWRSSNFRRKLWPRLSLHLRPGGQAVRLPHVSTLGLSPFTAPLIFAPSCRAVGSEKAGVALATSTLTLILAERPLCAQDRDQGTVHLGPRSPRHPREAVLSRMCSLHSGPEMGRAGARFPEEGGEGPWSSGHDAGSHEREACVTSGEGGQPGPGGRDSQKGSSLP